jgi:hypothetical protein
MFKWWYHPCLKRWQIEGKDWAGRYYVFDENWNLLDWEYRWVHIGGGKWQEYPNFQNCMAG